MFQTATVRSPAPAPPEAQARRGQGSTAVVLATAGGRIFSLSPRRRRAEAALWRAAQAEGTGGERGSPILTSHANPKQDGPPLPPSLRLVPSHCLLVILILLGSMAAG